MDEKSNSKILRQYYDDQGRLHIVRVMDEHANVKAEFAAKKNKPQRNEMQISYKGKCYRGRYGVAFRDMIMSMGWERVRDLNFDIYGMQLINQSQPDKTHLELADGWSVYTRIKPRDMSIMAYQIAKSLGETISITWCKV